MPDPTSDTAIVLAYIALAGTLITGFFNLIQSFFRHKETMAQLDEVRENVNGKMDRLLKSEGDSREATGKLNGIEEERSRGN